MTELPSGSEFGNYHIIRHIAGGGMAQIYLAKAKGLAGFEKFLALKVINKEYAREERFIQMLIDEAKITVALNHVNIGQVFDLGHVDGIYYIAMEFVDGVDILQLVNGLHALGERVPIDAVALVGRQICSGLHYAHTRKDRHGRPQHIVHRDISPQNVLVSLAGEVKVVDFGIAKAAGMSTKTQAGVIKGKVHYMSPEQAMGRKADHRSDIFSVGIVLWEMTTSQMVYSGDNVRELVDRVRLAKIPSPASVRKDCPKGLEQILQQALARRPEARFQTAHDFQVELTKFLSSSCPNYGATDLSDLVARVRGEKETPRKRETMSREDMIKDVHSVISAVQDAVPLSYARLQVRDQQGRREHRLGEEAVVGRAGNLAIADARVSRRHARIYEEQNSYFVQDMGSANGTYVNEVKLIVPKKLADKDVIRIGGAELTFLAASSSPARAPRPPSRPPVAAPSVPPAALRKPPAATSPPPTTSVPVGERAAWASKLVLESGPRRFERIIDENCALGYSAQIGPLRVMGVAGHVTRKNGTVWLEPAGARDALRINGSVVTTSTRLSHGDTFMVGEVVFRYVREPVGPPK